MMPKDYVYKYYPVEEQDRGARDEGYYYAFCYECNKRTEHEDGSCCECGNDSESINSYEHRDSYDYDRDSYDDD